MEYGKIIRQAYHATMKHKSLWFLGMMIFSGAGASIPNFSTGGADFFTNDNQSDANAPFAFPTDTLTDWMIQYWWLLVIIGFGLLVCWLVFIILHTIASAGMMIGADQARQAGKPTFGALFKAGAHYFWKVLGMNLLLGLVVGLIAFILSIPLILLAITIIGLVIAIPGFILLFAALMLVVPFQMYALQYLVLRKQSIMQSYQSAWQMMRIHFGHSIVMLLLLALISLGVAFGAIIVFGSVVALLVVLGFVAYMMAGWVLVVPVAILGGMVLFIAGLFLKGIMTTFQYNAWHLTFVECEQSRLKSVKSNIA